MLRIRDAKCFLSRHPSYFSNVKLLYIKRRNAFKKDTSSPCEHNNQYADFNDVYSDSSRIVSKSWHKRKARQMLDTGYCVPPLGNHVSIQSLTSYMNEPCLLKTLSTLKECLNDKQISVETRKPFFIPESLTISEQQTTPIRSNLQICRQSSSKHPSTSDEASSNSDVYEACVVYFSPNSTTTAGNEIIFWDDKQLPQEMLHGIIDENVFLQCDSEYVDPKLSVHAMHVETKPIFTTNNALKPFAEKANQILFDECG